MQTYAQYLVEQKALPKGVDNAGKLVMLLQAGRDLGLSPTQCFSGLAMINGIITVFGNVGALMMKRGGYSWEVLPTEKVYAKPAKTKDGETPAETERKPIDLVKKIKIRKD